MSQKVKEIRNAIKTKKLQVDLDDTKKWTITPDERKTLFETCGEPCFMRTFGNIDDKLSEPKKNLKFPICRPNRSPCAISASGIRAAYRRAILSGYPDVVNQTKSLISQYGITKKARVENIPIKNIKLKKSPLYNNKFDIFILYENNTQDRIPKPLTAKTILKKYGKFLSASQQNKLH